MGFFDGTTREMRFAALCFLIAAVGAATGFGSLAFHQRWIGIAGFAIVVIAVAVGFVAIIVGFVHAFRQR